MRRFIPFSILVLAATLVSCFGCGTDPEQPITDWDNGPAWSNAGDRLTFYSPGYADSIYTSALYVVDTNGENRRLLAAGGLDATWLPGDTEIIFFRVDFRLYYLNLVNMQESLVCDCADARFPEVTADGRHLYYEDAGVADNWATSTYRMDLATGDTTHIVGGGTPRLSPDERYLLVNRDHVYRHDIITDSEVVVFHTGIDYDWSPEGDTILVGRFYERDLINKIYKVTKDGSWSDYFCSGMRPRYSPSGNRIAVIRVSSDGKDHLWLINRDGRNANQITF